MKNSWYWYAAAAILLAVIVCRILPEAGPVIAGIAVLFVVYGSPRVVPPEERRNAKKAAQHEAERRERQRLIDNAETENELFRRGDSTGVFGIGFPQPKETQDLGIWMNKDEQNDQH